MNERTYEVPKPYHDAVMHWQKHNFPDYPLLAQAWDRYFPTDDAFCLCARIQESIPEAQPVGARAGEPRSLRPEDLEPQAAQHLLAIIRAQASTEFGSIQQHQATLDRANDDQDRMLVLRVIAEELRHGYQMIHLLTSADWSSVSDVKPADMVEEILSMRTGSHVLAAFNLEYDSFVDNVVFCAFIDRVGKYQLTMQKASCYRPFAASMPPMLREEAFHLATGVIPMRRWVEKAASGDPLITMATLQRAVNKWFGRGLEMFGHEAKGQEIVALGLKDMANGEAQDAYIDECGKMLDDLNRRYARAIEARGARVDEADLLRLPHRLFFRRRGEPAYQMVSTDGRTFTDVDAYVKHLSEMLPEAYLASRDVKHYLETLRQLLAGRITIKDAIKSTPHLARVGGACPCSNSVRWVVEESA